MSVTLKCPNGHPLDNYVDPTHAIQCSSCQGHIAPETQCMICKVRGCHHIVCTQCIGTEALKHTQKRRQRDDGETEAVISPPRSGDRPSRVQGCTRGSLSVACIVSTRLAVHLGGAACLLVLTARRRIMQPSYKSVPALVPCCRRQPSP